VKNLRIRQERKEKGWKLQDVGKQVGLTQAAISDIERGRRKPSYTALCKLEDLFNLSHRKLFAIIHDENPSE